MKRFFRIVLLSILVQLVLLYATIVMANNRIAKDLERQLLDYPLPQNTVLVDSAAIAAKTGGNGNGMQWYGAILVESELNEDELAEYYEAMVGDDGDDIWVWASRQESPYIFKYQNYKFNHYKAAAKAYQIQLAKYSAVGFENSLWEAFLNCDIRAH